MDTSIDTLLSQNPSMTDGLKAFRQKGKSVIYGLSGSQKSFLLSRAIPEEQVQSIIIVVHDKEHKELWERDFSFFWPNVQVLPFPITERVEFTTVARSLEGQGAQMRALSMLAWNRPVVVLATIEEATQYVVSPQYVISQSVHLEVSQSIERDELLEKLVKIGYERVDQVEQRGHFSVRGDIFDIFPVNSDDPIRMEFFGDEIDTMRHFSVDTQRSIETVDAYTVTPFFLTSDDADSTLLSYAKDGLIIYDEPVRIQEALKKFLKEDATHRKQHCEWSELQRSVDAKIEVAFTFMQQRSIGLAGFYPIGIQGKTMTSFERQIPLLMDEIKQWQKLGNQVVLVINNLQRREGIEKALHGDAIPYKLCESWDFEPNTVHVMQGLLTDGFELPHSRLVVVVEGNIYGQQKRKLRNKPKKGQEINYFTDLSVGDYVVHSMHGIGKYVGLKTIETEGIHRDYIEIAYAGTDRLYLPASNLDQLQKYIGNEGDVPRIHKMGGSDWRKAVTKAQKSIDDLADKLVELYAKREITEGFAFLPDQPWQQEFEDDFPYEETEDQLQATREIKESMERPTPMDRLLAGDVGFGKTEVAMRAIFKAVVSGKQVAVLVPTTVLAQQHYQTFLNRFNPFGVKVDVLNRFRSTAEKKEVLKGVENGSIDILIGTHSLLNKKVKFKDLGFLVVDEEQRFGVAQKEKWKEWASNIDVLTLSATPIPRTLHMSLVGVREMSVISTPPEDRLPVQTYVVEYDMNLIADAIKRELARGGQVYFVYNRVASINHMGELLEQALPDLRYAVAHGQMTGRQIEEIMTDFYEGHYDVLLSTSIIETGLDIPNANTIIIYDADRLGLSQLYQMRGRVGRSRRRAYAYFMYRPDKMLSEAAEKRLKAIEEFTELGAGFKLAMRDLEIRGAGNLLGSQQHGNIASVGFGMYVSMLEEAIAKAQNKEVIKEVVPDPAIDLEIDAFIDDAYIKDSARKISVYQRMLQIKNKAQLDDLTDELIDRFGTPTDPVDRLLRVAQIKEQARLLGIKSIVRRDGQLIIHWQDDSKMADWDMGAVREDLWKKMKFMDTKPASLYISLNGLKGSILTITEAVMKELSKKSKGGL
ncbi:transcription-repair coupling factor [Veillonella atypica ACS-134-V-Col7a]|uniref:Transcription-repair-coupling factor n=1 Tax=Veillonella atypica ACS-134-V-Col7a TaxID=866778 RepID=E1LEG6_9FIRM|nr:transcription-repair coupling factor [Veillonella atypica]EFL57043.1 transcription-repair coupling factor [Veillonella atypica ACS-134-V-Col7a]